MLLWKEQQNKGQCADGNASAFLLCPSFLNVLRRRKSGRTGSSKSRIAVAPFDEGVPDVLDLLLRFVEEKAVKSAGIFTVRVPKNEMDDLMGRLEREGRACVLGKETSVFAAAHLLDVLLNSISESAVPAEFHETVRLALVQSSERDRVRCLRRLFASLPPGNRTLLARLAAVVAALRSKQKYNKVDQACIDAVFSYTICHSKDETACGETSSLLADALAKCCSSIFGKRLDDHTAEKDAELPAAFLSALRSACDSYAVSLLPEAAPPRSDGAKRKTARTSRKSVQGWDDVFAVIKPINSKGETNKVKASPVAKELGKLLFESKMGAAKKYLEKKSHEIEQARLADDGAVLATAQGEYKGAKANGVPHGQGRLVFENGDVYEGAFVAGAMTGKGVLTMSDGSRFEGDFVNGTLSGRGRFAYANGDTYVGEFREDAFHGQGKYVSETTAYEGSFEQGLRHGKGVFKTPSYCYSGEYAHDQMCGLGIYTFANGDEYLGEFRDSQFHGKGIFTAKNGGRRVEGLFEAGRFLGPAPPQ